jgi:hypothetical protein
MHVLEIPGYVEALARERFLRDAAFLGVSETVYGFELKPLTLRHWLIMRIANSPLIGDGTPSPVQLAQFLWSVSTEYSLEDSARRAFLKRCRKFQPPTPPWFFETKRWRKRFNGAMIEMAKCLTAVRAYIDEATMDAPPRRQSLAFTPDYYSEVAFWVGLFGHSFHPDAILDMPLKVLYQLYKEALDSRSAGNKTKPIMFNPISERVRNEWTISQQRN